jgi:hypothetical protein
MYSNSSNLTVHFLPVVFDFGATPKEYGDWTTIKGCIAGAFSNHFADGRAVGCDPSAPAYLRCIRA